MAHRLSNRNGRSTARAGILALATAGVLGIGSGAPAALVTWDGNGNANNSGTWETGANWDTNAIPGTVDTAVLGDVTTGTRTVSVSSGSPQTIRFLNVTQTTAGAVNTLTLNDNLTLSHTSAFTPFVYTPTAGVGSIVTNISAGKTLTATGSNNVTANFGGTLNMDAGSKVVVQTTNRSANYSFNNSGIVNMDNAALNLDYGTADANNNPGNGTTRNFTNSGAWTLANNSSIAFTSSTGKATSGYKIGAWNTNSGTMTVASGSSIGFQDVLNTGALNLGSSTGGVSDATVNLGSPENTFSASYLVNGLTTTDNTNYTAGVGTIDFKGNVVLGRTSDKAGSYVAGLYNGANYADSPTEFSTGSVINIGDGTTPITVKLLNRTTRVYNAADNDLNLKANATLEFNHTNASVSGDAVNTLTNGGNFTQAGLIKMRRNASGSSTITTLVGGVHAISGVDAEIELLAGGGTNSGVTVQGRLTGTSAADTLTYINGTGSGGANDTFALNLDSGQVTPGNGNGSVGTLSLANFNVTFGGTSNLLIDLIGDSIDVLAVTGGALDLSGAGSQVTFAASGTQTQQRYVFATYSGTLTDQFASFSGISGASIDYSVANEIAVVVPEPGTLGVLAIGAMGLLARRRRHRA